MRQVFVTSHPAAFTNKYLLTVITVIIPIFSYLSFAVLLNISIKPPELFILISFEASSYLPRYSPGALVLNLSSKLSPRFIAQYAEAGRNLINRKRWYNELRYILKSGKYE